MSKAVDAGRAFFQGLAQYLPDSARAELEAHIATDAGVTMLTALGEGTLARSDYSRAMDDLKAKSTALDVWAEDVKKWAVAQRGTTGDPPADPARVPARRDDPAPTPGALSKQEVEQLVNAAVTKREIPFAAFATDIAALVAEHTRDFPGEVLDGMALLNHPDVATIGIRGAYRAVHAEKLKALVDGRAAADRAKLEAEIRKKVTEELAAATPIPGVIAGEDTSPLAALGGDPKQFSVEAAAAHFRQLRAGSGAA